MSTRTKLASELEPGDRIVRKYWPFAEAAQKTKLYVVEQVGRTRHDGRERVHVVSGAMTFTFPLNERVTLLDDDEEAPA